MTARMVEVVALWETRHQVEVDDEDGGPDRVPGLIDCHQPVLVDWTVTE